MNERLRSVRMMATWALLLMLSVILLPISGVHASSDDEIWQGPVTIHTRFTLPEQPSQDGFSGVWLAGIARQGGEAPTALSLALSQKSGWFPVWSLQLQSDQGLLPQGIQHERGSGLLTGSQAFTLPNSAAPRWGHTYETMFGYNPQTGALSLWIHDATLGEQIFAGEFLAGRLQGPFHPTAGRREASGKFAPLADVTSYPLYIPRGVGWSIVEVIDGQPGTVQLSRVDRSTTEGIGVRLSLMEPVRGTFRLFVQRDGTVDELAHLDNPSGSSFIPIPMALVPPGATRLVLEYADENGTTRFVEDRKLSVGRLVARFDPLTFDQVTQHAIGGLSLQSDGPLHTSVRIGARLWKQVWDEGARAYKEEFWGEVTLFDDVMELTTEPIHKPLMLQNPTTDEAELWRVDLTVEPSVDLPVVVHGSERLFATYRPAESIEKGPFTLVVLPDTQYQTHVSPQGGRPEILTRMIHWLVEQAEARKIGLVLHVGDITDHNLPKQWEVAQNNLYLLDGVAPYALAIGNHDIGLSGNAANRDTFFNEYFPLARYEDRPSYGGVFEPGRFENSYQRYRLGGTDYMVISLEFLPRDEVLDWANSVVAANRDHQVIVITHTYTSVSGPQRSVYGDRYGIVHDPLGSVNTGADIWEKFVRKHANIMMVFSGHVTPDAVVPRQVQIGDHGNKVYEMLINFQHRPEGGAGWLALLHFTPDDGMVGVEIYSPYLGGYRSEARDFFGVPFCIDLKAERYVGMHETCATLPIREGTILQW